LAHRKFSLAQLIIILILCTSALFMLVPILNIFAQSFSDPGLVNKLQGYDILPKGFSLINYKVILSNDIVWRSISNSIFITVVGVTFNILLTSSTAYVLTRHGLVGKKVIMYFLIIVMIFEPGIVQEYFVMKHIGLMDNLWAMVIYKSVNVYYLIILMRFFEDVPESLIEAATIDGAGHMSILFKIMIPLSKIPLLTVGMFYGVFRWNEFFKSSVYLSSKKNTVLQVLLRQFVINSDSQVLVGASNLFANNAIAKLDNGSLKAATIVIAMVPILMIYPVILKHYTSGVLSGGVKE
jgi:putative aldouronate transport system permease protein